MRIYLDESKQIDEWKIIIGWFFTHHNTHFIDTFIKNKKKIFSIPENAELKSTKKFWKLFIENITNDSDFNQLQIFTFWFKFENYFNESEEWYVNLILETLILIFNCINLKKWGKINIFHDHFNAKNNKIVEKKIDKILIEKYWIKSIFKIHNSKNNLWIQLADLIVWTYRKYYLHDDVTKLDEFIYDKDFKQ